MKQHYILILSLLLFQHVTAQQDARYALYRYHMNMFNPAVNGIHAAPYLKMTLRSQWSGIEDAPETQVLSYATPTGNERVSLGFNVINDYTFVETQTQFFASFSYLLELSAETKLFLGLQAGSNAFRVSAYDLTVYGSDVRDPNLLIYTHYNPNIGAGLYLNHPRYFFSLSAPRLLNSERYKNEAGLVTTASDRMHVYGSAGLRLPLNGQWTFVPSAMSHYTPNAPSLWVFNLSMVYNDELDFGVEYTPNAGLGATMMLGRNRFLSFGYAYTHTQHAELRQLSRGTHEALLRIRLAKMRAEKEPVNQKTGAAYTVGGRKGKRNKASRDERKTGTRNKEKN